MHLLFHRTTPWREPIRGSTNVFAQLFAEDGHAVTYMEGTAHLGHLLRGSRYAASWRRGPRRDDGAWVFTPLTLWPYAGSGAFATPDAVDRSYRSAVPSIPSLVRRADQGPPDVLWTARPGASALGRLFPEALLVMQVVDYYPAFGGAHMEALERQDYARADLIFSIGDAITTYLTEDLGVPEEKVVTLGQGVFLERFAPDVPEPSEWADLPRPRAVWVGWTDKVDAPLFEATAEVLSRLGGSLVLIGGETDWAREFAARHAHVHLLGPRPPEVTPAYLMHADLGLMLYDQQRGDIYRGQHPLKLYEYAAAGLAILSTPHDEFETLRPPVLTVASPSEVGEAVETLWRERETWGRTARAFAERHAWSSKYERAKVAIEMARAEQQAEVA